MQWIIPPQRRPPPQQGTAARPPYGYAQSNKRIKKRKVVIFGAKLAISTPRRGTSRMNRSRPTGVSMRSHYKEAKAFVERQLSMSLGGSEEAVIAALQDGTVLCRLCASLLPDLAMGKPKTPSKKVHFRGAAFENWDQFGKLCRKLQVDESFIISMSALAASGSGNTRPVWRCIVEIKSVSGVGAPRPAPGALAWTGAEVGAKVGMFRCAEQH